MQTQKFTVEELEQQHYDVKRRFADTAGEEIQKLLEYKYSGCSYDIKSTLYETLLEEDYDHQQQLWSIKDNSLSLLELMAHVSVASILQPVQITHCVKMLRNFIDFADRLDDEKSQAELDAIYMEHNGTESMKLTANIKKEYTNKIKLAHYEKELERA